MKTYTVTITERGQITLPAEICKQLGVKPGDRVQLEVESGAVRVSTGPYSVASAFGSVQPLHLP